MNLSLFLGRFHPLVVHLPIGFLILAALFFFLGKREKYSYLQKAVPFSLGMTCLSAYLSVLFGWLLANQGGYEGATLIWHRWLGIGLAVGTTFLWRRSRHPHKLVSWPFYVLLGLLLITGHLGGNLTHGKGYLLAYGPSWLSGAKNQDIGTRLSSDLPNQPDSIKIYDHLIQPILNASCIECHNEEKQKGKLLLSTKEGLLKGGENGKAIVSGAPMQSELLRRVTLDPNDRKFMPPKGKGLSYQEIKLIDYWISSGHSFDLALTHDSIPKDILWMLEDYFAVSKQQKSYVEKININPLEEKQYKALENEGFYISTISETIALLSVKAKDKINANQLKALHRVAEYIAWLDLSGAGLTDNDLKSLSKFSNLTKLNLSNNEITDQGLAYILSAKHLESLNLYGTKISDTNLNTLAQLKQLNRLYVWQSQVTEEGKKQLSQSLPGLEIE